MDKKEVSISFFFNFHILLMLKCFWKYLLKVRQVKNRQFRKQYARTQLEKKRRRWYNAESEIFSRKNNPLRQLYTNKMCAFKTPSYFCSFKVIYHGFGPFLPQKIPGYPKSTRGTGKVYTFFTVRCVPFGLPTV